MNIIGLPRGQGEKTAEGNEGEREYLYQTKQFSLMCFLK